MQTGFALNYLEKDFRHTIKKYHLLKSVISPLLRFVPDVTQYLSKTLQRICVYFLTANVK